jgi:hypothetical protein
MTCLTLALSGGPHAHGLAPMQKACRVARPLQCNVRFAPSLLSHPNSVDFDHQ